MGKQELFKAKAKASTLHIILSVSIAALVGFAVFFIWYPSPFGFASGGLKLFLLITAVDLVLGPALTFVAYNPMKRRALLLLDFSVIGMFQIAALVYGVHTVFVARPVVVAFEGARFRVVSAIELSETDLKEAKGDLGQLSLTGPKLLGTRVLQTSEEFESIQLAIQGKDIGLRPRFWVDYQVVKERVKGALKPLDLLQKRYPESRGLIEDVLKAKGVQAGDVGFMPVLSKQGIFTAICRRDTGDFVDYIMLDGSL